MLVNLKECVREYHDLQDQYIELLNKYNRLIVKVNKKGGEDFLDNAVLPKDNVSLSKDDLNDLVMLCHPDRHENSERSLRVTRKIILLRKM